MERKPDWLPDFLSKFIVIEQMNPPLFAINSLNFNKELCKKSSNPSKFSCCC